MNENQKLTLKKGGENTAEPEIDRIIGGSEVKDDRTEIEKLKKREQELNMSQPKFKAKQLLIQNGLSEELADILKLDDEESVTAAVEMLVRLSGKNKNEYGFKVLNEKKLPEIKDEEKNTDRLRKAFGLM